MPAHRLSMRKLKEVLRLTFGSGLSQRQVARSLSLTSLLFGVSATDPATGVFCWTSYS
jgi:hypothetical protein